MTWNYYLSYFFGGAFLANAIPHFVSGTMGRGFQTPFATPPGQGLSSSTVNVVWAAVNFIFAYLLLCQVGNFDLRNVTDAASLATGALASGLFLARRFGRFNGGNQPTGS